MQSAARALLSPLRPLARAGVRWATRWWAPHTRLFIVSDSPRWVLAQEQRELAALARRLGIATPDPRLAFHSTGQCLFYLNHFGPIGGGAAGHRVALTFYHGRPGSGEPGFDASFEALRREHERVHRVVVTHREMRDLVLETGIDPAKVFLIPLAVKLEYFPMRTADSRRLARERLGVPADAQVVGSFQKDGVGWGEGAEPKLVKGPDVFLDAIERLRPQLPRLFVLLGGPSRGYVKAGLTRLGVPFAHHEPADYAKVGELYQALDVYIVSSRQEGGPKAVLESMASGVPLVTTRVGQAMDLVEHGRNGWMVEVEESEGLARWAEHAMAGGAEVEAVRARGRALAEANSYEAQLARWREFMHGFVEARR